MRLAIDISENLNLSWNDIRHLIKIVDLPYENIEQLIALNENKKSSRTVKNLALADGFEYLGVSSDFSPYFLDALLVISDGNSNLILKDRALISKKPVFEITVKGAI